MAAARCLDDVSWPNVKRDFLQVVPRPIRPSGPSASCVGGWCKLSACRGYEPIARESNSHSLSETLKRSKTNLTPVSVALCLPVSYLGRPIAGGSEKDPSVIPDSAARVLLRQPRASEYMVPPPSHPPHWLHPTTLTGSFKASSSLEGTPLR